VLSRESDCAEDNDSERDEEVHWEHGADFNARSADCMRPEIRVQPLRTGPEETETGLNCRAEVCFGRSYFVQKESEIEGDNTPDER